MNDRDLINRFVSNYRSIYSVDLVVECTGLQRSEVSRVLNQLVIGNVIRRISQHEPIFITNRGPYATRVCTIYSRNWVFNLGDCQDIAALLKCTQVKSIREIAVMLNRSRQWVYMYLEALISVDVIGINESGYYTKSFTNIYKVGSMIKKGIIHELRTGCGIKPNRKPVPKTKPVIKAKTKTKPADPKHRSLRRIGQATGI